MSQSSDNILEDCFVRAWKPLCALQNMIGSARVRVVNNVMLTRLWYQKAYGCFIIVLSCIGMLFTNLTHFSSLIERDNDWKLGTILSFTQLIALLLINSYPIIANNFFNLNSNHKLFMSLQRIDQTLKITTNEHHYRNLYKINAVYVAFLLIVHVTIDICLALSNLGYHSLYIAIPTILILTAQDLEIAFFNGVIVFLVLRVRYINSLLKRSIHVKWQLLKQLETPTVMSRILDAYRHVLSVYELLQCTSAPFLLLLCLHMFTSELIILEELIMYGNKMDRLPFFQWLMVATKVYNRILVTGICVVKLEQDMLKTRLTCLRVINQTRNKETRRLAKNLFRLITLTRPMTIFGMVPISSLPLQMAAVTTTYAVVLLQLNFQALAQEITEPPPTTPL